MTAAADACGGTLTRAARVEARLEPHRWLWREANGDLIARHWERRRAETPALFDGRVLMVAGAFVEGGQCRARFFETGYAELLAWKACRPPDDGIRNGFAMGALRGRDGGFLLGRMAAHTANAGRLYFPCGTPDLSDVRPDGIVDLAGSLTREIGEETGLGRDLYRVEPGWTIVEDRGLLAFIRLAQLSVTAEAARDIALRHIASDARAELDDVRVVRDLADLQGESVPGVVPLYLSFALAMPSLRGR